MANLTADGGNQSFTVYDETDANKFSIMDLKIGMEVKQSVFFGAELMDHFNNYSKDLALLHNDNLAAKKLGFSDPIVQGLALGGRFSRLIGMYLPGENCVLEKISFKFHHPVYINTKVELSGVITRIFPPLQIVKLELRAVVNNLICVTGDCQCVMR